MKFLSLIWGILALIGMIIGFIPCFGAYNWINIPFAAVGLILSIIAIVNSRPDESKGSATAGLILCAAAMIFGLIRLLLGGGVF
jgi:hypothetical protein